MRRAASRMPKPQSSTPQLFETIDRSVVPCARIASTSAIGLPHRPNPPTASEAPSSISATVAAAESYVLSIISGLPSLGPRRSPHRLPARHRLARSARAQSERDVFRGGTKCVEERTSQRRDVVTVDCHGDIDGGDWTVARPENRDRDRSQARGDLLILHGEAVPPDRLD